MADAERCAGSYSRETISRPTQPNAKRQHGPASLTAAERRVLLLLPSYRTLGSIGAELGIGRPTVKTHVASIYRKLGAGTREEAVKLAEQAGLLELPNGPGTA